MILGEEAVSATSSQASLKVHFANMGGTAMYYSTAAELHFQLVFILNLTSPTEMCPAL